MAAFLRFPAQPRATSLAKPCAQPIAINVAAPLSNHCTPVAVRVAAPLSNHCTLVAVRVAGDVYEHCTPVAGDVSTTHTQLCDNRTCLVV